MADAKQTKSKKPAADSGRPKSGGATDDFQTFALEYEEDSKTMKVALIVAVVFHLIVLAITIPSLYQTRTAQAQKKKVYVVQQVRFKPPPPKQQQELPKPKAMKIPIPDPTPDQPEPIRQPEQEQQIQLPDSDVIFGIPEGPPAVEPQGPIQVGGDVKKPIKVYAPQPEYTEIARKARITGVVIVQAIIDKQGNVTNVKLLKSLPMGLGQSAVEAIKKWKFKPATLNGKPVEVYYNLTVNFQLQ